MTLGNEVDVQGFASQIMREQALITFTNGYSASVIRGLGTYGSRDGLWEVAVLYGEAIVYDTPVTNNVIGHLDSDGVTRTLAQIAALPPRT